MKSSLSRRLSCALLTLAFVSTTTPAIATSAPQQVSALSSESVDALRYTGIGVKDIPAPSGGARTIYVAPNGTNVVPVHQPWGYTEYNRLVCLDSGPRPKNEERCPEPDIRHPLETIQGAVRIAKPGDVIVVRGGTYDERVGWSALPGTPDARIHLQSYPGERVQLNGYLSLREADYWTVRGFRFGYSPTNTTGESIVNFFGGTGWSFVHNEVAGTQGVANVLVRNTTPKDKTEGALRAAAPHDYLIGANCIRSAARTGTFGQMQNIYLMPSIYSTNGIITRNVIAGAPLGANIKAAGSTDPKGSPRNVEISRNTLMYSSTGISIGQLAESVTMQFNLIARSTNSGPYSGGVKAYELAAWRKNAVKDSLISGYDRPIREEWEKEGQLFTARNVTPTGVAMTGSIDNCTVRPADSTVKTKYGHYSG